jgi:hypothetical protein
MYAAAPAAPAGPCSPCGAATPSPATPSHAARPRRRANVVGADHFETAKYGCSELMLARALKVTVT